jgi:2'-5' RNA ligase
MIGPSMSSHLIKKEPERLSRAGLIDYLLIAAPCREVMQKVMQEKEMFNKQYLRNDAVQGKPGITISNFFAREEMEDTMVRWMQRIVGEQKSFPVMLNNYSGCPPHTVFLRVQDPSPFKLVALQLKPIDSYITTNGCPPVKFVSYPHLTIARGLAAEVYERAIREYAEKEFNVSFNIERLVLLRRGNGREAGREVAVFHLQP